MEPILDPDYLTLTGVRYAPVSGAGSFGAVVGNFLWFTPRHLMAMIRPDPAFLFSDPPFAGSPVVR